MGNRAYVLKVATANQQFLSPQGRCAICAHKVGWGGKRLHGIGAKWSGLMLCHHRHNRLHGSMMAGYQRKHLFLKKQVDAVKQNPEDAYKLLDFLPLCWDCHEAFDLLHEEDRSAVAKFIIREIADQLNPGTYRYDVPGDFAPILDATLPGGVSLRRIMDYGESAYG